MIYSLDTNTCIRVINQRSIEARTKLLSIPSQEIVICTVVRAELFFGAAKSQTPTLTLQKQEQFLRPYITLAFDDAAARAHARIRADLARLGTPIGPYDSQIAAIALAYDLILVTHNTREFSRVAGLKLEDWQTDP